MTSSKPHFKLHVDGSIEPKAAASHAEPQQPATSTLQGFLQGLEIQNKTLASWARDHGFALGEVYSLTRGRTMGRRGQAREILKAMGITPVSRFAATANAAKAPPSQAKPQQTATGDKVADLIAQTGTRLRAERRRLDLTQEEAAALAGVSRRSWVKWESGVRPRAEWLQRLTPYGFDVNFIVTGPAPAPR